MVETTTDREIYRQKRMGIKRQKDRQRQTESQTDRQTYRQTNRQTDRQTERQADRQTDGRNDRQTERQNKQTTRTTEDHKIEKHIHKKKAHNSEQQTTHSKHITDPPLQPTTVREHL